MAPRPFSLRLPVIATVAAVSLLWSSPSRGQAHVTSTTGRDLLAHYQQGFQRAEAYIRDRSGPTDFWFSDGYYVGYVDGVFEATSSQYCLTAGGQLHDIVAQYLLSHPKELDRPAADLVRAAFKEAFPCSSKRAR